MGSNTAQLFGLSDQPKVDTSLDKYRDIIQHERPTIAGHPPLSQAQRAAQFIPFAALVGYDDLVAETEDASTFAGNIIIPDSEQLEFADLECIDNMLEDESSNLDTSCRN